MRRLNNQLIKWAFGALFACFLLIPDIFLVDKYISKGNDDILRLYMTIIILVTMVILAIAVTIIIVKNQKYEKRLREGDLL